MALDLWNNSIRGFIVLILIGLGLLNLRYLSLSDYSIDEKRHLRTYAPHIAPHLKHNPNICTQKHLWGEAHAGGWNICLDYVEKDSCIVYSFGLGADWSFDKAAEAFGCVVHGFDPSGALWRQGMHGPDYSRINYSKQYPSKGRFFHNWGVGAANLAIYPAGSIPQQWPGLGDPAMSRTNTEPWDIRSISQSMSDLNHTSGISILKIDVEGAEWDAITAFLESYDGKTPPVKQLLAEFHWDPDSSLRRVRQQQLLDRLERLGFHPWHVERHLGSECCLDVSYVYIEVAKEKVTSTQNLQSRMGVVKAKGDEPNYVLSS